MTNFTIKIEAVEIADAMNNLAVAITGLMSSRAEKLAEVKADATISKAAKRPAKTEPVATPEPEPEPVAIPSIADLMAIASAKAKTSGAEKVKGVIGACGAKTIKELPEDRRAELKLALECLS